VHIRILKS